MTLQELEAKALSLSDDERWQLISSLISSLRPIPHAATKPKGLAASLIGIAKTDELPATDAEIKAMLGDRLVQKYL